MNRCAIIIVLYLAAIAYVCVAEAKIVDEHVYLVPAEGVDRKTVEAIKDSIPANLPVAVKVEILPEDKLADSAYDSARRQYNAQAVLDDIHQRLNLDIRVDTALIIVDTDLYSPELNFVFGLADMNKKTCIISLSRLRNEFYNLKPNNKLFLERAVKEAIHELGHVWGLAHCTSPRCAMYFSNSLPDTDRKRSLPCVACRNKLSGHFVSPLIKKPG